MNKIKNYFSSLFYNNNLISLLLNIVIISLIIVSIVYYIFYNYLPKKTLHNKTIAIPLLVGLPLTDGVNLLEKLDLRYEVIDTIYNIDYDTGTIVRQNLPYNHRVKLNRKVYLTVSTNILPTVQVPDILYSSLKNAKLLLGAKGLQVGATQYISDLAKDVVLGVIIDGKRISNDSILSLYYLQKGFSVDLILGDGLQQNIIMPYLIDIPYFEAKAIITELGLKVGLVKLKSTQNQNVGRVTDQFPGAGEIVKAETLIQIYIEGDTTDVNSQ